MSREKMPKMLSTVALPVIALAGYFVMRGYMETTTLMTMYYRYALASFVGVIVLMETRVILGKRGKRDGMFYVHLLSGIATVGLLTLFSFRYPSELLKIEMILFSSVTLTTGLFLLYRK